MMCRDFLSITVLSIFLQILAPGAVPAATLVINEVYYDHPGSDDGWEYVEIINTSGLPVLLEGWSLAAADGITGSMTVLWDGPGGGEAGPYATILVGGEMRVQAEGYRLSGRIENGPDCVMLLERDRVVDIVGYGDISRPDLFEGTPAVDVSPGMSLSRRPDGADTGDNGLDFVGAMPTPGRTNFYMKDLAVETSRRDILCCAGGSYEVSVSIANTGLMEVEGPVWVSLFSEYGGCLSEGSSDILLSPGEIHDMPIHVPFSPIVREEVSLVMQYEHDMNSDNDSLELTVASSPMEVVINELMPRPPYDGCEWIELYNRSSVWIDIREWSILDRSGSEGKVPRAAALMGPGSFVVLTEDRETFLADHPDLQAITIEMEGKWPRLNDSGEIADVLMLFDGEGRLVDETVYGDLYDRERGRSLERFSPDACSCLPGGIWLRNGSRDGSTAGEVNSVYTAVIESPGSVSLDRDCLSYDDGSELVISGTGMPEESGVNISIFDMGGIRVRRLYACDRGARSFSCRWDGADDSGVKVSTGLYICVIEFLGQGGVLCRRVKECVAVYDGGSWR